jgi:hypothetical protein
MVMTKTDRFQVISITSMMAIGGLEAIGPWIGGFDWMAIGVVPALIGVVPALIWFKYKQVQAAP